MREIVQRTKTVVRTIALRDPDQIPLAPRAAERLNGQPYTLPEDAVEWVEALATLRRSAHDPKIYPFREHLARACEKAAQALRDQEPPSPES
ncbi:hypothetical protein ACFY3E_41675 [Streptomyces griseorubiginosus]|uniref:hypothetical protein n=1 Tax=Streptomyces griseorubiginosus TaxID=67304 RepID=UPI0036974A37